MNPTNNAPNFSCMLIPKLEGVVSCFVGQLVRCIETQIPESLDSSDNETQVEDETRQRRQTQQKAEQSLITLEMVNRKKPLSETGYVDPI
jgi:hypothetical protein